MFCEWPTKYLSQQAPIKDAILNQILWTSGFSVTLSTASLTQAAAQQKFTALSFTMDLVGELSKIVIEEKEIDRAFFRWKGGEGACVFLAEVAESRTECAPIFTFCIERDLPDASIQTPVIAKTRFVYVLATINVYLMYT